MVSECVRCFQEMKGYEAFSIRIKICCPSCCYKFKSYVGHYRGVTKNYARRHLGCSKGDLEFLNCTYVVDTSCAGALVTVYLEAEVTFLGALRHRFPNSLTRKALAMYKPSLMEEKKTDLEDYLPGSLDDIDPDHQGYVLGDYMSKPFNTIDTVHIVSQRFVQIEAEDALIQKCNIDRVVAREFLEMYPGSSPKDYRQFCNKAVKIFRLEGDRIMRKLTSSERASLVFTPCRGCAISINLWLCVGIHRAIIGIVVVLTFVGFV